MRGDLLDVRVEEPQRVGVREHEAGDVLVGLRPQVVQVHAPVGVRADLHDGVAGHRHRRGVRAVRGVRREDLVPRLAAILVVGAGQQHAGELAVRAGAGLQRDVRQPGDLAEGPLQLPHELEGPLGVLRALERVQARVPRERRHALVQARVVLHRARAERVEARVEVEVPLREVDVVADDLRLGDLGQRRRGRAPQARRQQRLGVLLGDVERRAGEGAPARGALLEDRPGPVALQRRLDGRPGGDGGVPVVGLVGLDAGVAVQAVVVDRAHAATSWRTPASARSSTSARRSMSAFERCSVSATSSPAGCSS